MRLAFVAILSLAGLSACTPLGLGGAKPEVAQASEPSPALSTAPVPPPAPPVVSAPAPPPAPAPEVPVLESRLVAYTPPVVTAPLGKPRRPAPEPSPAQVILEAQREARVAPTKRGYFGGRGVQRYLWSPGKIYDVYLSAGMATKLEFPPGELLAHALMLNPKSFDVTTATVGNEVTATSVVLIRPCALGEGEGTEAKCVPSPEVDVSITSASGRSYDLHLIIGKVGMVGVTWEVIPIPHIQTDEPPPTSRR